LIIFCFLLGILLPSLAFPVFLGYGIHLIGDSLTKDGIQPFWPLKKRIDGSIRTGGRIEDGVFISFVIIDVILIVRFFV